MRRVATSMVTRTGAASCSLAASIRRRRSSRRGFRRSPIRPSRSIVRSKRHPRHSRCCVEREREHVAVLETTVLADPPGSPDALARLRSLLLEEGGLIATLLDEGGSVGGDGVAASTGTFGESPASVAAQGPRTAQQREEYELLVEAIYEGYLLHY